jgi:hypothetical protein
VPGALSIQIPNFLTGEISHRAGAILRSAMLKIAAFSLCHAMACGTRPFRC